MRSVNFADIRRFYRYLTPYLWRTIAAFTLSIPVSAFDAAIAMVLGPYTNQTMIDKDIAKATTFFPILVILFAIVEGIFKYSSNYCTAWVGKRVANDIKMDLFEKLMKNDTAVFDNATSGEILVRYNGDADVASESLFTNINLVVVQTFKTIFLMGVLIYQSWILAIVAISALLLALVPLTRVRKRIKQLIAESVVIGASVSTNFNEAYAGNRTVTSYNLFEYQRERMKKNLARVFRLSIKMVQRVGVISVSMHFIVALGIAGVIWLQGYLIVYEMITPGDFVSFMAALLMLYTPVKGLGNNYNKVQTGLMAVGRVLEILDRKPAIVSQPDAVILDGVRDGIEYRDVGFAYEADKPVLKHINLSVKAGQSIALVGNSGGGKTTLVNLLPRFYDVGSGSIAIDGVDIRDIDLHNLRQLIAIVFQDNFLFGGTIRDNILIGKRDASDGEIAAAVKAACLEEFIGSLELGLDTEIGERGVMLSGGQKQRVAIARAFVKDAPIVILDEATSALDNKSETVVQQAIENLMQNKTVFIIAHRLSTVVNADRIVVIQNGEMVETGSHAELIAKPDGMYASLYRTQLV